MFYKLKISKADKFFSQYIRTRDKWTCVRCRVTHEPPTSKIQNSHFFSRGMKSVRFDPENCDALCVGCHIKWGDKEREAYRDFKVKQLGAHRFDALTVRAHIPAKVDESLIVMWCKRMLDELKSKEVVYGRN